MKNFTRVLVLLLAVVLVIGLVGCTGGSGWGSSNSKAVRKVIEIKTAGGSSNKGAVTVTPDYTLIDKVSAEAGDTSWATYKAVLGEFYSAYLASNEVQDVSARYALQAIAEAKLMESGAFLPTTTQGGNYAIGKVAPKTVSSALFGNDSDRMSMMLVATDIIKAADRAELNKIYAENVGTGKYLEKAEKYLKDHGYTLKDSYSTSYSSEPQTWDILATYRAADAEAIVMTYDNLVEYDNEGRLLGALATACEVSADGTEYTFKLREGVKWVTVNGEEYAEVVAEDFVTGLKHLIDAKGGLESLIFGIIKNAAEYSDGKVTDFAQVGVKAVDKYTLKYTLETSVPYFPTMLNYNLFAPLNAAYFAQEGDAYGTSPDHILYCGPYVVSNHTENNKIVFSANDSYYAKDEIRIKTITWNYNDGQDVTKAYNDFKAGTIDATGLNTTTIELAKKDNLFDDYAYVSSTNATSYCAFINVARQGYTTVNYPAELVSTQTDAQKAATKKALTNQNFRLALLQSINRVTYNAVSVGEELATASLRNSYTPGTFVALEKDVVVPINGKNTTFKAGTYYGAIMQAQIDADGYKMKVWDPTLDGGAGSSDTFDGWYNPTEAKALFDKALTELAAQGLTITAENPIVIDYPYYANDIRTARANALKQDIESNLGGKVIVNIYPTTEIYALYYAGYYLDNGAECNYDVYDVSGWGPDYGDPATYLNTMLPFYSGDMTHCLGLY